MAGHARTRVVGETVDAQRALEQRRRLCAGCGEPFEPVRRGQPYCRPSCRATGRGHGRARPLLDGVGAGPSP
mgnify:CR=1 FL=1